MRDPAGHDNLLVSGGADNTIQVRDVSTGQRVRELTGHSNGIRGLTVTPDGTRVYRRINPRACIFPGKHGRNRRSSLPVRAAVILCALPRLWRTMQTERAYASHPRSGAVLRPHASPIHSADQRFPRHETPSNYRHRFRRAHTESGRRTVKPSAMIAFSVCNAVTRSYCFSSSGRSAYGTRHGCFLFASSRCGPYDHPFSKRI